MTSTYFEGQATRNPLARRATAATTARMANRSASGVTREGMPLGYAARCKLGLRRQPYLRHRSAGLGDGPWNVERGQRGLVVETGRRYLIGALNSELRKWSREIAEGPNLADRARRGRSQAASRAGRERDVPFVPLSRSPQEGAGHARALLEADLSPNRSRCLNAAIYPLLRDRQGFRIRPPTQLGGRPQG